jgi:hypothetical protein
MYQENRFPKRRIYCGAFIKLLFFTPQEDRVPTDVLVDTTQFTLFIAFRVVRTSDLRNKNIKR